MRELVGLPWAVPPEPPKSFDCWALVIHARRLMGKATPSYAGYYENYEMGSDYFAEPPAAWTKLEAPEVGCVVRFGETHVGVLLPQSSVIHSTFKKGVRVDKMALMERFGDISYWEHADA